MILVCGATGMFGGQVLAHLLQLGAPVRGLTSTAAKRSQLAAQGADVAFGNLDKPSTLPPALEGVERVFLVSPMDDRIEVREKNMIAAAEAAGVRQVVKLFGAVKHRGDALVTQHERSIEALQATALSWTLVSPNTVMETNLLPQASTIHAEGKIYAAAGEGRIGMVALQDCARAAATVLTQPIEKHHGQNYEITGPEALTFADIAAVFSRVLEREITYVDMPVENFGQLLVQEAGFPADRIETDVLCHMRAFRRGDANVVTDTFSQLTGLPSTTLESFIRQHRERFVA